MNDKTNGTFVALPSTMDLYKAHNNIFAGMGTLLSGSATTIDTSHNIFTSNISSIGFNDAVNYDYHLTSGSVAINAGANPGNATSGFSLTPVMEYNHPTTSVNRGVSGTIDVGAYEFFIPSEINEVSDSKNDFQLWVGDGKIVCATSLPTVTVNIFDLNGRLLISKNIFRGISTIDLKNVSAGIYFVRMETSNASVTEKIVLLK